MKHNSILLKNPRTGTVRQTPLGFSWTVLLFGFFVPLLRRDWFWTGVMFIFTLPTCGLSSIIFSIIYNSSYICRLIGKGYRIYRIPENLRCKDFEKFFALQDRVFNKAFPPIYDYRGELNTADRTAA